MKMPNIKVPISKEKIPEAVQKLIDFIREKELEIKQARSILELVQGNCDHKGAKSGYNLRDGSWMYCDFCKKSE